VRFAFGHRVNLGIILVSLVLATVAPTMAQADDPALTKHEALVEISRLIDRVQEKDPEEQIISLEAALRLEQKTLPLDVSRRLFKSSLLQLLGLTYESRRAGTRADNLEKAIGYFDSALTVITRNDFPSEWAQAQHNLGDVYAERIRDNRADNLEKAIAAYESALTIRTRDSLPKDWAQTQHRLGTAYLNRILDDRAENMERAIACFEAALTVATRDASPQDWAATQNDLALAYMNRIRGDHAENREKAISLRPRSQ
jgi:tetratricopeptide (TPR) repeat protein